MRSPSARSDAELDDFLLANTAEACAPLVEEIRLRLATEITPIWQATEALLAPDGPLFETGEPPFWAFAWPGAQALARRLLDEPATARGRRVLDFAAGCGLAAIAACRAGAACVEACELDPLAVAAIRRNAAANGAPVRPILGDLVGSDCRWDLILCGDVCYEAPMTGRIMPWLRAMAAAGAEVWIADPGRAYLPRDELAPLGDPYDVPTTRELEDRDLRRTTLYRLVPPPGS